MDLDEGFPLRISLRVLEQPHVFDHSLPFWQTLMHANL
jgi:hypothetical protein